MSTQPAVRPRTPVSGLAGGGAGGLRRPSKRERQEAIVALVRGRAVRTQEEIVAALHASGLDVTQATVSRDLRDLGLARVHEPGGARYVVTDTAASASAPPRLRSVMREHVRSMEFVGHLGVIRTRPSSAPLVAAAIDQSHFDEVAGTVAGDDTVLVVIRSVRAVAALAARLRAAVGG